VFSCKDSRQNRVWKDPRVSLQLGGLMEIMRDSVINYLKKISLSLFISVDIFLRTVGSHKIYTAPHPRRRHSSLFIKFLEILLLGWE
jgi:predicted RNA binding protein YcfA (HicA-like mRNA interferase family)